MDLSLEYIGGFFDGEGCISIPRDRGFPFVIVTNTRLDILQAMQEFFDGVGKITLKKRTEKDAATKLCWQWRLWNRHAEFVLRQLRPHLILKAAEADMAFAFYETRLVHGSVPGQQGNPKLTSEIRAIRADLAQQAREAKCA